MSESGRFSFGNIFRSGKCRREGSSSSSQSRKLRNLLDSPSQHLDPPCNSLQNSPKRARIHERENADIVAISTQVEHRSSINSKGMSLPNTNKIELWQMSSPEEIEKIVQDSLPGSNSLSNQIKQAARTASKNPTVSNQQTWSAAGPAPILARETSNTNELQQFRTLSNFLSRERHSREGLDSGKSNIRNASVQTVHDSSHHLKRSSDSHPELDRMTPIIPSEELWRFSSEGDVEKLVQESLVSKKFEDTSKVIESNQGRFQCTTKKDNRVGGRGRASLRGATVPSNLRSTKQTRAGPSWRVDQQITTIMGQTKSPKRPLKCPTCFQWCDTLTNLFLHKAKTHEGHLLVKCQYCDSRVQRSKLAEHVKNVHERSRGNKGYYCSDCVFITSIPAVFEVHSALHRKCPGCEKVFKQKGGLWTHISSCKLQNQ